ncbi:hypothetical protein HK101_007235 [Irineochytrium annulatum]|nr:hypothetical protein HK101_007235 [Irineochytrium annulatum]
MDNVFNHPHQSSSSASDPNHDILFGSYDGSGESFFNRGSIYNPLDATIDPSGNTGGINLVTQTLFEWEGGRSAERVNVDLIGDHHPIDAVSHQHSPALHPHVHHMSPFGMMESLGDVDGLLGSGMGARSGGLFAHTSVDHHDSHHHEAHLAAGLVHNDPSRRREEPTASVAELFNTNTTPIPATTINTTPNVDPVVASTSSAAVSAPVVKKAFTATMSKAKKSKHPADAKPYARKDKKVTAAKDSASKGSSAAAKSSKKHFKGKAGSIVKVECDGSALMHGHDELLLPDLNAPNAVEKPITSMAALLNQAEIDAVAASQFNAVAGLSSPTDIHIGPHVASSADAAALALSSDHLRLSLFDTKLSDSDDEGAAIEVDINGLPCLPELPPDLELAIQAAHQQQQQAHGIPQPFDGPHAHMTPIDLQNAMAQQHHQQQMMHALAAGMQHTNSTAIPPGGSTSSLHLQSQHHPSSATKQKRQRTTTHTPRPSNSFILYRKEKHGEIMEQYRGTKALNNNVISKIVASMWRNEKPEVKAKYAAKAEEEKRAHMLKYPDYKYKPRKAPNKAKHVPGGPVNGGQNGGVAMVQCGGMMAGGVMAGAMGGGVVSAAAAAVIPEHQQQHYNFSQPGVMPTWYGYYPPPQQGPMMQPAELAGAQWQGADMGFWGQAGGVEGPFGQRF